MAANLSARPGGLFQVNHKYPVFSGANIGIKPICLILFLMFAHLYRSHKRTQMMVQRYNKFLTYANLFIIFWHFSYSRPFYTGYLNRRHI